MITDPWLNVVLPLVAIAMILVGLLAPYFAAVQRHAPEQINTVLPIEAAQPMAERVATQ